MKTIKFATLTLALLGLMACSSTTPIQTDHLKASAATQLRGEIITVEEVKVGAEFAKRFKGAVAGQIIGAGLGLNSQHQSTLKFLGAMAGVRVANKYYGRTLNRIAVMSADMQRFEALVPSGFVTPNETVRFTAEGDQITSMVKGDVMTKSTQTQSEST
jgi:outer membrane lipoprotein SlyB